MLFSRVVVSLAARRVKEEIVGGLEKFEANGRYDGIAYASTTIKTNSNINRPFVKGDKGVTLR